MRKDFVLFIDEFDKKEEVKTSETFPEMTDFYQLYVKIVMIKIGIDNLRKGFFRKILH